MIVVTGGCGFIGSNLVRGLNSRNIDDIVVVDDLSQSDKFRNMLDCRISDYVDYRDFLNTVLKGRFSGIELIFHQGACSDTMESDGQYMMRVNYEYSRALLDYSISHKVPFIYASSASVYGNGSVFAEDPANENALNIYAYSKLLFDRHVRRHHPKPDTQVVGLRYFNVYGPCEQHKGRMASVAYHFYNQLSQQGRVRLFEGSGGYGNGEQRRDFVWVEDAVDINLFFMDNAGLSGIYNAGTGQARSFNAMARAVISSSTQPRGADVDPAESDAIEYIAFPEQLVGKYQSFTQADLTSLRSAGYAKEFTPLETGVKKYVEWREPG